MQFLRHSEGGYPPSQKESTSSASRKGLAGQKSTKTTISRLGGDRDVRLAAKAMIVELPKKGQAAKKAATKKWPASLHTTFRRFFRQIGNPTGMAEHYKSSSHMNLRVESRIGISPNTRNTTPQNPGTHNGHPE